MALRPGLFFSYLFHGGPGYTCVLASKNWGNGMLFVGPERPQKGTLSIISIDSQRKKKRRGRTNAFNYGRATVENLMSDLHPIF
jgi:hypothetical protein